MALKNSFTHSQKYKLLHALSLVTFFRFWIVGWGEKGEEKGPDMGLPVAAGPAILIVVSWPNKV